MSRSIALAVLLTLAAVAPVGARSATPVLDPNIRERITPPAFAAPCMKPGHICRPTPVRLPR